MADPTPPQPTPAFDWVKIISVILAAFLGGMKLQPHVEPVPVPPAPVVVVPPLPQPEPLPPRPLPSPVPLVVTGIHILDVHGLPLGTSVDAGILFQVVAPEGTRLQGVDQASADFLQCSPHSLHVVLRSGCLFQVMVAAPDGSLSIVSVQCNHAPQPPPPPGPSPSPLPAPGPLPVAGPVSIVIVEDAANRSMETSRILSAFASWKRLLDAGHTRVVYSTTDTSAAAKKTIADLAAASVPVPGILVYSGGKVVLAKPMPSSIPDLSSLLFPYTNVAL